MFYPNSQLDQKVGFIFYPGGKVEHLAYAPMLTQLSNHGITCVLVKMPLNLAVFNINAADSIKENFDDIDTWYIGGHSLGGAMASSYIEGKGDQYSGLILMGAYPINTEDIKTLAIYGSEDMGLDLEKLESTANTHEISGGNHAYFGNYGEQAGDGIASMSREEQQTITVQLVSDFINSNE